MTEPSASTRPTRRRVVLIVAALALLAAGGAVGWVLSAGNEPRPAAAASIVSSSPAPTTKTIAGAGECHWAARTGATVTDDLIDKGCSDDNGSLRKGTVRTCKNGQRLWKMDGLIGLSGETMVMADTKTDDGMVAGPLFEYVCSASERRSN